MVQETLSNSFQDGQVLFVTMATSYNCAAGVTLAMFDRCLATGHLLPEQNIYIKYLEK